MSLSVTVGFFPRPRNARLAVLPMFQCTLARAPSSVHAYKGYAVFENAGSFRDCRRWFESLKSVTGWQADEEQEELVRQVESLKKLGEWSVCEY